MIVVRQRLTQGLLWSAAALTLCGCSEMGPTEYKINGSVTTEMGRRAQLSPRAATVAFTSLEGSPQPLTARFADDLAKEAKSRSIMLADAKSARYLVRGYLTAYPSDDGTALSYVWDVFDSGRKRARRVSDTVTVKGSADDPWSVIDDGTLQVAAARSADDLLGFLATTPEAVAANQGAATPAEADAGTTVVAATPPAAILPGPAPSGPGGAEPVALLTEAGAE